jgi:hypothetical protein
MNINTGDAGIDSPSDALTKTFIIYACQANTKNPSKEPSQTLPAKEPNTLFNPSTFQSSFPLYNPVTLCGDYVLAHINK